jgi:hypothetical protein
VREVSDRRSQRSCGGNVDGYELSYSDDSVITHYSVLVSGAAFADIEREFAEIRNADPPTLRRPDRLDGLSPWADRRTPADLGAESRVRAIISSMDSRGAWVEVGTIGKANRLVSVLAGRELVVTLGGKTMPLKENETLEVFAGPEPPQERIIRSRTFAENVGVLSAYLRLRLLPVDREREQHVAAHPAPLRIP